MATGMKFLTIPSGKKRSGGTFSRFPPVAIPLHLVFELSFTFEGTILFLPKEMP